MEQMIYNKYRLIKQFDFLPGNEEIEQLELCKSEISLENVARSIIMAHLDEERD